MSNVSSEPRHEPKLAASPTIPSQYAAVKWSPKWGFIMVLVSFVASQVAAIAVVAAIVAMFHISHNWLDSTAGQFVFMVIAEGLALIILQAFLRRRKATLASIGFPRPPSGVDLGYAVGAGVVYFVLLLVAMALASSALHINLDQKQELGFDTVVGHADMIMAFVSLVLLPPIVEETLFRGVLFGGFRTRMNFMGAALLTSGLFAFPHLLESGGNGLLWVGGIDTFILSMVLCYLRERTRSLWAGVFLHMLKNGIAYLYLYVLVAH